MRFDFFALLALLFACLAMIVGFIRTPRRRARRFFLAALVAALFVAGNADARGCRTTTNGKNGPVRNLVGRVVSAVLPNRASNVASAGCAASQSAACHASDRAAVPDSPSGATLTSSSCPGGACRVVR